MLQSNQQCVLYLHFRSTPTRVSFHTERKSILHTWKQLVMLLLELNLHWIIHGWVIQGEYYICSRLLELPLLFIFIGAIHLNNDCRTRSCICWTWEHFILASPPCCGIFLSFFFSPVVVFVVCCVFGFFVCLFRVPAWGPKVNASAFESRWLPVDMPSADAHVEYVLSSKHLGCYIKKCSAFQNPSDGV